MESWSNTKNKADAHIQWIEYSQLKNVQETTLLQYGCTHEANWLEPATNKLIKITFKTIVGGQNSKSFDFYQVMFPL